MAPSSRIRRESERCVNYGTPAAACATSPRNSTGIGTVRRLWNACRGMRNEHTFRARKRVAYLCTRHCLVGTKKEVQMMRIRVMKLKKTSLAVAAALALGSAAAVHAEIGFKAGAWDLSFSGNVNGFATWNSCDTSATVVKGGLACNNGVGGGKEQAIESGLLPSALVFGAKTSQSGFDIGWTIGFYPGLNDGNGPGKSGLSTSTIDLRQNFLTFGDKSWGTFKVGKDIGLFASDAILADMTLLGVGSAGAFGGGNTTLGRIGVGYIYTDWIPQISYSSPKYGGFQYSAGVFQGVDIVPSSSLAPPPNSATLTQHEQPGLQAKGSYEWTGTVAGKAWASVLSQKVK